MDMIVTLLMIFLLVTAFFMVFTKQTANAVIAFPIFGSILVVLFVIFQAPSVAMAEAVITAGLATGFFVITFNKTKDSRKE
ncbi:Na(+)/H(+) antiporter subunit B [Aquibacillus sediminis]|uniref:Na(+)/H(+) antiporter subunit B n=1 Tax=Aquibacillus sediminis TaxID=2574734 RepID=UPI001FE9A6F6|nr:hydrogenase subunit MbhD domain-containing protein [Aquibacillus sediminis]